MEKQNIDNDVELTLATQENIDDQVWEDVFSSQDGKDVLIDLVSDALVEIGMGNVSDF